MKVGSLKPLIKLIPVLQSYVALALCYLCPVYDDFKLLFLIEASAIFGVISVWMIICNVTNLNFEPIRLDCMIYMIYGLLSYYGSLSFNNFYVHLFMTVFSVLYMSYFFCTLALELSHHLDVPIFSTKKTN